MNKKFYSFGIAAMMLLFSGNVMAKDYYVSATGDDANDGLTEATAVKTLKAVMSKVKQNTEGEIVHVSGIIKVDELFGSAHYQKLVVEGSDPEKDGFDAEGKCGIFSINNSILTFKNLSFKNGYRAANETGAGAIFGNPMRLILENCVFEGNHVDNANSNQSAGAIFLSGDKARGEEGGIFATNCKFINNFTEAGGGAFAGGSNTIELNNCYIKGNKSTAQGGAIYGNTTVKMNINGCTFEGNEVTNGRGGAIYLFMKQLTGKTYTVSNSTFYQNKAKGEGGAFCTSDDHNLSNNTLNFVHCTVVGNTTGGTVGSGGGISIDSKPGTVNIVNTLAQGNLSTVNQNSFADVAFGTTAVNFVGSYVGYVRKYADNESYYTSDSYSKLNALDGQDPRKDATKELLAYADYVDALHVLPLKSTSDATFDADLSADAQYGVTKDQLGKDWTEAYIGAVQLTDEQVAAGISGIKTDAPKSIKGIYNIAGQYVGNDASQLAKGLYIINGKKVIVK